MDWVLQRLEWFSMLTYPEKSSEMKILQKLDQENYSLTALKLQFLHFKVLFTDPLPLKSYLCWSKIITHRWAFISNSPIEINSMGMHLGTDYLFVIMFSDIVRPIFFKCLKMVSGKFRRLIGRKSRFTENVDSCRFTENFDNLHRAHPWRLL